MCGIAGVVGGEVSSEKFNEVLDWIAHRGPDDLGVYRDAGEKLQLGHRRLAILDLSPRGHQPMSTHDDRFTIVFNGEIYNFRELRTSLQRRGVLFKGDSDTEVILQLYASEGDSCVEKLEGMYAFAIWDRLARRLFCARDPLGIKPFYYWQVGKAFGFASELRALLRLDLAERKRSSSALYDYLLYGSVQDPETLVEGVYSLDAGHTLALEEGKSTVRRFWTPKLTDSCTGSSNVDYTEAVTTVRRCLEDTVRRHLVSDVPVGLFLSGGVDSSAVLAIASAQSKEKLKSFCISFDDPEFDEGSIASETAKLFGTDHHTWKMSAAEGKSLLQEYLQHIDQPSNDGFNTFCVSRFARNNGLKVVLSGLGGDELFGGYPSFALIPKLLKAHRQLRVLGPPGKAIARAFACFAYTPLKYKRLLTFLHSGGTVNDAYLAIRGFFNPNEVDALFEHYGLDAISRNPVPPNSFPVDIQSAVSFLETTKYMKNQLLRDSDVMSMASGLELRTPLVDRQFIDCINECIPSSYRYRKSKQLLVDAVPELPDSVKFGSKKGFRFPFESWISTEWKDEFKEYSRINSVDLKSWSRKWCLFVLNHFYKSNAIN